MASEKLLDEKLYNAVKALGGIALKLICLTFTGLPDRTILLPGGRICFAEMKSTGKKPTPRQLFVIGWLRKMGFKVYVIDSNETLDNCITELKQAA